MVFFLSEKQATKLFKKYPRVVAFATDRAMTACTIDEDTTINYMYPSELYPTVDEINGYVRGDISCKKIIKKFRKRMNEEKFDPDATNLQVTVTTLVNMLADKTGTAIVFLKNNDTGEEARRLNKMFKKYIKFLFNGFGIEVQTKVDKKLLKGKKKDVAKRILRHSATSDSLSKVGRYRLALLQAMHYAEVQQCALEYIKSADDLSTKAFKNTFKRFYEMLNGSYATEFLQKMRNMTANKSDRKLLKHNYKVIMKTAKKNVAYYNEYCDLVNGMGIDGIKTLPKVPKLGKKFKKKSKTKFFKFYMKRKNFGFLYGAYKHIVAQTYRMEIGSTEYNSAMADAHRMIPIDNFAKSYGSMCTKLKKALDQSAKTAVTK